MVSMQAFFWVMVSFFALIGFLRGWTKEIIATAGLVLSLFALNQFGPLLVSLLGSAPADVGLFDPNRAMRQQFYILSLVHLAITFFSYEGPALAGQVSGGRLSVRVRENLQEKLLGAVVGGVNGYLIFGTLWSFLEYRWLASGYERLLPGEPYAFSPAVLVRPEAVSALDLAGRLPLPMLAPYLPVMIVVVFLFVIIVMI